MHATYLHLHVGFKVTVTNGEVAINKIMNNKYGYQTVKKDHSDIITNIHIHGASIHLCV